MNIQLHTQNMNLSDEQKSLILKKIEKLTRLADKIKDESSEIKVDIKHEGVKDPQEAFLCKISVYVPQDTLHAEARDKNMMDSVDDVVEKLRKQIEHYKDKIHHLSERKR
jgi:ribosomal subunit interface protein